MLTSFIDYDHVPAIRAGARGYLLKDIEPEDLVVAIRRVYKGQVELHPDAAGLLMTHVTSPAGTDETGGSGHQEETAQVDKLTRREQEVLRLIASGMNNRKSAKRFTLPRRQLKPMSAICSINWGCRPDSGGHLCAQAWNRIRMAVSVVHNDHI